MKNIIASLLVFFSLTHFNKSYSQLCLGEDTVICIGASVTINNCPGSIGGSNSTAIVLNAPTFVNLTDDVFSGVVNIGFPFSFYNNVYNQGCIGSNGVFSFNLANANTGCSWALGGVGPLPSAALADAMNGASICYMDLNPGAGGTICYQTIGTAPNRRFVVLYANVPTFQTGECNYMAIILNETSNTIEYHIGNKPINVGWNGGLAIQGTENSNATVAHTTAGRNNTVWGAVNDSRMYTPTSPANTGAYAVSVIPFVTVLANNANYQWANTLGQTFPYNNGVLTVQAPTAANSPVGYFLAVNGGNCTNQVGGGSDTTWVGSMAATATLSGVDDICSAGVGSITVNPTGTIAPYSYNWPALGVNTQTASNLTAGTYQVTVTDGNGCTVNKVLTIGDTPAQFSGTTTDVSCAGGSDGTATATMTPVLGNVTYLWDDPAAQTTQTAVGLTAGTYNCVVTSDVGCSQTVTVNVVEIPNLQVNLVNSVDATCNSGNDGIITVSASAGTAPYAYSWDNSTSVGSTANDLYAGTHTVTVTDANGCIVTLTETIGEPNPLQVNIITLPDTICLEDTKSINVTGSGGSSAYTYTWYDDNSNYLGTGTTIVVDPTVTTDYMVVMSEVCGSPEDTAYIRITIPEEIRPSLNPNFKERCFPASFEFTNDSYNATDIATLFIDFGDNQTLTEIGADSTSHAYVNVTGLQTIYLLATSIHGCVYDTTLVNHVNVLPKPRADFTTSANPTTIFETTVNFREQASSDVVLFQWDSPNSFPSASNLAAPTFQFEDGVVGNYPVTLTVTTEKGCTDTITKMIHVVEDMLFFAPNAFTPDGDEFNQTWNVSILGADIYGFNLKIFNRWGEIIWENNDISVGWDGTYNGKPVMAGTYVWKAVVKNPNDDAKREFNGIITLLR